MRQGLYTVLQNRALTEDVRELRLSGDTSAITAPGQFVNIAVDGCFLRRPISVSSWNAAGLTLVYKIVGRGTQAMAALRPGQTLDLLCGLGNGFAPERCGKRPLLLGGGLGAAPLYGLAKALLKRRRDPVVVLGFNTESEIFYEEAFRMLGVRTILATADGSAGVKGLVTDALPDGCDVFAACGPVPMLRAVCEALPIPGFVSLEERMGCGFGACMGCSIQTKSGSRRVCKDGPVFAREELVW